MLLYLCNISELYNELLFYELHNNVFTDAILKRLQVKVKFITKSLCEKSIM